jgi:Cu/Ag efflux pump CusA
MVDGMISSPLISMFVVSVVYRLMRRRTVKPAPSSVGRI